ncbi:MAG: hypothetical protein AAF471_01485 [Myxococcota bacterium]
MLDEPIRVDVVGQPKRRDRPERVDAFVRTRREAQIPGLTADRPPNAVSQRLRRGGQLSLRLHAVEPVP